MKICVLDTETTALPRKFRRGTLETYEKSIDIHGVNRIINKPYNPRGEVIQLSFCVSELGDFSNLPKFYTFYVNPTEPISDGAKAVHGISNDEIHDLSKGIPLEAYLKDDPEISKIFHRPGIIYIGHNITFDINMINSDLKYTENEEIDFGDNITSLKKLNTNGRYHFDTMSGFRNIYGSQFKEKFHLPRIKNPKLMEALKFFNITEEEVKEVFQSCISTSDIGFHNAVFDVAVTWVLFNALYPRLI